MSSDFEQAKSRVYQSEGAYVTMRPLVSSWEQRKLVGLCSRFCDGDWIESKDQSAGGIRLIQTGNVGTTEFLDKRDRAKWISEETFERLNCTEIFAGDILISRLPEPAGRACILPDLQERMITAVDCTIVRTSEECDSSFLVQFLSSEGYFKEIGQLLGGGTRQRVTRSVLGKFDVPIPSIAEQRQIGSLLSCLDSLITLHQREPPHTMKEGKNANRHQWRITFLRLLLAMD